MLSRCTRFAIIALLAMLVLPVGARAQTDSIQVGPRPF